MPESIHLEIREIVLEALIPKKTEKEDLWRTRRPYYEKDQFIGLVST